MSSYELQFSAPDAQDWQVSDKASRLYWHHTALAHAFHVPYLVGAPSGTCNECMEHIAWTTTAFSLAPSFSSPAGDKRDTVIQLVLYNPCPYSCDAPALVPQLVVNEVTALMAAADAAMPPPRSPGSPHAPFRPPLRCR